MYNRPIAIVVDQIVFCLADVYPVPTWLICHYPWSTTNICRHWALQNFCVSCIKSTKTLNVFGILTFIFLSHRIVPIILLSDFISENCFVFYFTWFLVKHYWFLSICWNRSHFTFLCPRNNFQKYKFIFPDNIAHTSRLCL